eukprot:jgi/Botrbrau1/9353/Bobra.354_2s0011.1
MWTSPAMPSGTFSDPKSPFVFPGCSEGRPKNVVREGEDVWFATNETQSPLPWVELHLPANVALLHLQGYTFAHGHCKSNFYRMRFWKTQLGKQSCKKPGASFIDLPTKAVILGQGRQLVRVLPEQAPPHSSDWSVVRLVGCDAQQDGVYRLAVKGLKLYGTVRINLMRQGEGLRLHKHVIERALTAEPVPVDLFPSSALP